MSFVEELDTIMMSFLSSYGFSCDTFGANQDNDTISVNFKSIEKAQSNINLISNVRVSYLLDSPNEYIVKVVKTVKIFTHSFGGLTSEILKIPCKNKKIYNFLLIIEKLLDMPFIVFFNKFADEETLQSFYSSFFSIFISEYIPLPNYKPPVLEDYRKIDISFNPKDLIVTKRLKNYFDNNYLSSFANMNRVNYHNKDYIKYVKSLTKNVELFCKISKLKYKETKNKIFYNNYIISRFILDNEAEVESDLDILLKYAKYFQDNKSIPENENFFLYTKFNNNKQRKLFNTLKQIYGLQLLEKDKDNWNFVRDKFLNYENGIKLEIIKNGPFIPDSYARPYDWPGLKWLIYNYLRLLNNYESYYKDAYGNIYAFEANMCFLTDDELFNLGLYLYIFRRFYQANDIFNDLYTRGYDKENCEKMLIKLKIATKTKDALSNIDFKEKNIYEKAYKQLCDKQDYKTIQNTIIESYKNYNPGG